MFLSIYLYTYLLSDFIIILIIKLISTFGLVAVPYGVRNTGTTIQSPLPTCCATIPMSLAFKMEACASDEVESAETTTPEPKYFGWRDKKEMFGIGGVFDCFTSVFSTLRPDDPNILKGNVL